MEGILKGLVNLGVEAVQEFAAGKQERNDSGRKNGSSSTPPPAPGRNWNADGDPDLEWRNSSRVNEDEGGEWETQRKRGNRKHYQAPEETKQGFRKNASEQEYLEPVDSAELEPSEEELGDYRVACSRLWDLDLNRLVPGEDYEIECGDGKRIHSTEDVAENSLFSFVNQEVFKRPTFARFYALLDNYHADQDVSERFSSRQEQEQIAFVEEISRTAPIQYLLKYLAGSGVISSSMEEFKQELHRLWFGLYKRDNTRNSSSAFEHVFVGEVKDSRDETSEEVSGLHNWIQFYMEEAKGALDYQGYILPRRRGVDEPDSRSQLITLQFTWNGARKPESSTFVGVSPEFELALFTLCFLCGEEDNHVMIGPYAVNIKCYRYGRNQIGSVYPIAE